MQNKNNIFKKYSQLESFYIAPPGLETIKPTSHSFEPVEEEIKEEEIKQKEDVEEEEEEEEKDFADPAEAARYFVENHPTLKAGHCWDWVKKIYDASGFTMGQSWQDLNYEGKIAGTHRASQSQLQSLRPGDWLYINNRNKYDTHGNHSVIFLGWKGPNIAEVASYYDNSSHIHSYDVNEYPVTHITKYVKSQNKISNKINILIKNADYFYKLANIA